MPFFSLMVTFYGNNRVADRGLEVMSSPRCGCAGAGAVGDPSAGEGREGIEGVGAMEVPFQRCVLVAVSGCDLGGMAA
ncbi:hypothetical protein [Streptomyces sp. NPDC021096]|uniref:hypothetical protein n=1 Tax=Streptomyces sp. NPDC021096 TaxID=3154792 RepID=UPI0033ECDDB6